MLDLIKKINDEQHSIPQYFRLIDIFEGNLNKYVAQSLAIELSPESLTKAITRIPSINLLRRICKKLSKVYTDTPKRTTLDPKDQEQIASYIKSMDLQNKMSHAEDLLNLQKCCALEPYLDKGTFNLRVLGPHEFTVLSEDSKNPLKVTTFIKYMGSYLKGKTQANIYWLYTDALFLVVDSDGDILDSRENPYGMIPFVYVNSSQNFLKPRPDNDSFDNTVLIPKLLSDLNYAVQYQSHSIMYSIDAEFQGKATGSPDAMWNLKSTGDGPDKSTPQVGVLSPSVDTEKVLALITFTVSQWLESRGIKPGTVGSLNPSNLASGISKIIDEADAAQVIQENRLILAEAEQRLWTLIGIMHNALLGTDQLNATRGFTEPLEVSIAFPEQKPIPDPKEKRDDLKFRLDNKLTSYMRALKEANPNLTDDEILKLKAEIDQETAENTPPQLQNFTNTKQDNQP